MPWFDFRPGSPYYAMWKYAIGDMSEWGIELSPKLHKLITAPRGVGKTSLFTAIDLADMIRDRSLTWLFAGETKETNAATSAWLRERLIAAEPLFGQFRTKDWAEDSFTIVRPPGATRQPTVVLSSPQTPRTGSHADRWRLDDLVGEFAADNPEMQKRATAWVKRLWASKIPSTNIRFSGTMWFGNYHPYRWIVDEVEAKGMDAITLQAGVTLSIGKYFSWLNVDIYDSEGQIVFPWVTQEFLEEQKRFLGPEMFDGQYRGRIIGSAEMEFRNELFVWMDPPESLLDPTRSDAAFYILTDTAASERKHHKSSRSAFFVVAKQPTGHVWVLDGIYGYLNPESVADGITELVMRWPQTVHIVFEDKGMAPVYRQLVEERLRALGRAVPVVIAERWGRYKGGRILQLRPRMLEKKLIFSRTLPASLFHLDHMGEPCGVLADEFRRFSFGMPGSYDGLDALADAFGLDRHGAELCPTPGTQTPKKHSDPWSSALERLRRKKEGRRIWV